MFGCYPREVCPFLKRNKGVDLGKRDRSGVLGGEKRRQTEVRG